MKNLNKFLNFKEVIKITGLSRTTLWRLQKDGKFPPSKKISDHRVGFLSNEIDAWINSSRDNREIPAMKI